MSRRVGFHKLAETELNDAAAYYFAANPRLATAFLAEIYRSIHSIVDRPEAGLVLAGSIRRRLVRRFPYAVVYSIKPESIRILAIMHLRRHPAYWLGRR